MLGPAFLRNLMGKKIAACNHVVNVSDGTDDVLQSMV